MDGEIETELKPSTANGGGQLEPATPSTDQAEWEEPRLSPRAKLTIILPICLLAFLFLLQVRSILSPFLWALLAAYLLAPLVRYLNADGGLPRLWSVLLIYALIGILLLAGSRYLYPRVIEQGNLLLEDIPKIEAALIARVGPRPGGIDIASLVDELLAGAGFFGGNSKQASHLLVNALETVVKVFLFLVTTFYLLMDAPRIKGAVCNLLPDQYRDELEALGQQIHLTWQQYIRGELVLFVIMATVSSIGLSILQVPGAIFLGLATGGLELLPLVGPWIAGAMGVSVAYFNGTNPFGWSQEAYAGIVALMYFVLRQAEDYLVIPNLLGRAVRLHPVVVLFAVATGGVLGGLFGLIIAVPIAASLKQIGGYLYTKIFDLPVEFQPIRTLRGSVIEIPVRGRENRATESAGRESAIKESAVEGGADTSEGGATA